jgi:hypothetical protein
MHRRCDIERLYDLLAELEASLGGHRRLADATGRLDWPQRGVYFIFEHGERREDGSPRVARVGTHGLKAGSKSTLWGRLRQHRGTRRGDRLGGNHRGSVFRLHVGGALMERGDRPAVETWATGSSAPRAIKDAESPLEVAVSAVIGDMDVLWVEVDDPAGPDSLRGWIETNAIGLLSNRARPAIDPPSQGWLGRHARAAAIRESGLWNVNHVDGSYEPAFLDDLEHLIRAQSCRHVDLAAEERGA